MRHPQSRHFLSSPAVFQQPVKGADGKGKAVEVTSKTADKSAQLDKEARIRAAGGKYVRDPKTKQLIEVKDASRVIRVD